MAEKKEIYEELYEYMGRDSMIKERSLERLQANEQAMMFHEFENDSIEISNAYTGEYFMQPGNTVIHWGNTHLWHLIKGLQDEIKDLKEKVEVLSK